MFIFTLYSSDENSNSIERLEAHIANASNRDSRDEVEKNQVRVLNSGTYSPTSLSTVIGLSSSSPTPLCLVWLLKTSGSGAHVGFDSPCFWLFFKYYFISSF